MGTNERIQQIRIIIDHMKWWEMSLYVWLLASSSIFVFFSIINLNQDLNYQFWSRKGEKNLYKKRQTEKRLISFRIMVIWPRLLLLSASITTTLAISWQMRLKIEIYRTLIAFHPHSRTRIAALRGKQIDEWCRMWLTIANHS